MKEQDENRDSEAETVIRKAVSVDLTQAQLLLIRRLRFVATCLLVFAIFSFPVFLPGMLRQGNSLAIVFNLIQIGIQAYLVYFLYSRKNPSTWSLRVVEAVLFSLVAAGFLGYLASPICLGAIRQYYDAMGISGLVALSMTIAFPAMSLMVLYGVFIPNAKIRCLFWISVLFVFPVLMSTGFAVAVLPAGPALGFIAATTTFLGLGAAIALYGAFRIEKLQRQVAAGRRLGPYRLVRMLGQGGMGQVFFAQHQLLKRPCAIKVMSATLLNDHNAIARFEREVEATASLNHPNIIQIYDYGLSDDGNFYYAMEHLNGWSLDKIVRDFGPLPGARVVRILQQICDALLEAHQQGLIHRDLKPANIMLCSLGSRSDVVKLLDFGLVRFKHSDSQTDLTMAQSILGSPEYMSPEQVKGGGTEIDHRADLYSLGATAYFMVSGRPPFERDTAIDTMMAHYTDSPESIAEHAPGIDQRLSDIIMTSLAKEPGKRIQNAALIRSQLDQIDLDHGWTDSDAATWWSENSPATL